MPRAMASHDALRPNERAILEGWDSGLSIREIAILTDNSERRVRIIVSQFDGDDPWQANARAGSIAMAAAVLAIGSYA